MKRRRKRSGNKSCLPCCWRLPVVCVVLDTHNPPPTKSRNVLYLWQCLLCQKENGYFGRTIQKSHERTNTHRRCFSEEKWEDSALSMHARTVHGENFSLANFRITLVKKCPPQVIRREEFKHIDKYRTRVKGINRYKN